MLREGLPAFVAVVGCVGAAGATPVAPGVWTVKAIVEARAVLETAISTDGVSAIYLVRRGHAASNTRDFVLKEISLRSGEVRNLVKARWIAEIEAVPDGSGWSMLADLGSGVQLYRIVQGQIFPLKIADSSVVIGVKPQTAVTITATDPDRSFGVLGYGWSPDGRAFWYSTAREIQTTPDSVTISDRPLVPIRTYRPNVSELHVVEANGADHLISSAAGEVYPFPSIVYSSGAADWFVPSDAGDKPLLSYRSITVDGAGRRHGTAMTYDVASNTSSPAGGGTASGVTVRETTRSDYVGRDGRTLAFTGPWGEQHLLERIGDRTSIDFGRVDYIADNTGVRQVWRFPGQTAVVMAVRHNRSNRRNDLVKLTRDGRAVLLEAAASISSCSFAEGVGRGICVREGINIPPRLVVVDVDSWTQRPLAIVDPEAEKISPLRIEARTWKAAGAESSGFITYPRNFVKGKTYPAIVITHGDDGDNTFLKPIFQWNFPAQLWAERGYFVAYVNEIPASQTPERAMAFEQWASLEGSLPASRLYDLIWLDNVMLYDEVIGSLSREKLVDPAKAGIAGFSRGAQMVNTVVTQSKVFSAASSGDGGSLAPSSYWLDGINGTQRMLFGGSPYDPEFTENWRRLSPVFRAKEVSAAVLFQVANEPNSHVDFPQALRDANVPAEYVFFSGETHQFHEPRNQVLAIEQNLDWFDFWLRGIEDSDPRKAAQYTRWRALRSQRDSAKSAP